MVWTIFCCDRYGEDCGRRTLAFLTVVVERKRMVSDLLYEGIDGIYQTCCETV